MTFEVPLHGKKAAGRVALVDSEDFELVSRFRWNVQEHWYQGARTLVHQGPYVIAHPSRGETYRMHTLITGWSKVDHVNHDGLDNRRSNLRLVTSRLNSANAKPQGDTVSGFKGVTWTSRSWRARITIDGTLKHLGVFDSEVNAALAYDEAARKAWGEFAYLNFPEDIPVPGEVRYEF